MTPRVCETCVFWDQVDHEIGYCENIQTIEEETQANDSCTLFEHDNKRRCYECGKVMLEGYVIDGGFAYYCSDACLEKNMTREEFNALYADGEGESYWTEWEDDGDVDE